MDFELQSCFAADPGSFAVVWAAGGSIEELDCGLGKYAVRLVKRHHMVGVEYNCSVVVVDKEPQLEVHNFVELDNLDCQFEEVLGTVVLVLGKKDAHTADLVPELNVVAEVVYMTAVLLVAVVHIESNVQGDMECIGSVAQQVVVPKPLEVLDTADMGLLAMVERICFGQLM